jgi:hypothetical protein
MAFGGVLEFCCARAGVGMRELELERITAHWSERDRLAAELARQLQEVQAEREEFVIAGRVLSRLAEPAYGEGLGLSSPNCRCRVIER